MNDDVLTLPEAAKETKISEQTLYRKVRSGEAPGYKPAGKWLFYRSELHAWVRSCRSHRRSDPLDRDPMPRPRKARSSLEAKVIELEARRAG